MGGTTFVDHSDLPDVAAAFAAVVDQAGWEHGHGGYSGTIAEKHDYEVFPVLAGHTADEVVAVLMRYDQDSPLATKRMHEVFDDKWGPAVALHDDTGWTFTGWASS